jgi:hypothetical protein
MHKVTIGPRKTWAAPPTIVLADADNGGVGGAGGGGVGAGGVGGASFAVGVGAGGAAAASRVSEAMRTFPSNRLACKCSSRRHAPPSCFHR